jgi:hypothetical protein
MSSSWEIFAISIHLRMTATVGKKNWAIVHSTDAFGMSGFNALSAYVRGMRAFWAHFKAVVGLTP